MTSQQLLKNWAYTPQAEPLQELSELSFMSTHAEELIHYLNDSVCSQRLCILDSFYKIVGTTVSKSKREETNTIEALVNSIAGQHGILMNNWAGRTKVILRNMRKYDYMEWCESGFAKMDLNAERLGVS